ncbi:hypothetical protein ACHWQZ_G001392 [Mnemiopsis leidyi]
MSKAFTGRSKTIISTLLLSLLLQGGISSLFEKEKCSIQETYGFLKEICPDTLLDYKLVFKCPFSEEHYFAIYESFANIGQHPFVNATCSDDPYGYQVCGTTKDLQLVKSTDWSLCGHLYCESEKSNLLLEREDLCKKHSTCTNLYSEQIQRLKCGDGLSEDLDGEIGTDDTDENDDLTAFGKMCDDICDDWNCADESECNGFFYGATCWVYNRKGSYPYIPPYEICDSIVDCLSFNEYGSDEMQCGVSPGIPSCVSGHILKLRNIRKVVPILNFTRCSSIIVSSSASIHVGNRYRIDSDGTDITAKFGMPYCDDYMDQTNCSDSNKTAVRCNIKGYGLSTISKTMVCGPFRRDKGFCDNGLDVACVSVGRRNCTLHKHQLCDKVNDCASGADEKHPACFDLTEEKCFRNYRTGRELRIPHSWLGDGLKDCINGMDENWKIVCGRSPKTERFEVSKNCQDVFICRFGSMSFIRLRELCNGIEKCGNEILICQVGRSLPSISTAVRTSGNAKTLKYCHRGLEDVVTKQETICVSQEFNPLNESIYGVGSRISVKYPKEKIDCRSMFGEAYVFFSCLGMCEISPCPLQRPIHFNDCPDQYKGRVYTVANKRHLTFVTKRANDYHNDYFVCKNGMCTDYDKVCNMWDDCGDGSDEINCTNSFHCKDEQGNIPLTKKCDGTPDCGDVSDECNSDCSKEIINQVFLKGAAWLIGFLAMVSNAVVLFENLRALPTCKSADHLTNKLLVNLIALGDFLLGGYLFVIAAVDSIVFAKNYCTKRFQWLTSWHCSCLGVISTFGSLVSLFSLTCLSIIRAFKISSRAVPQDEDISWKRKLSVVGLVFSIVTPAVAIASVTLSSVFEDYFVNGLVYDNSIKIFPENMIRKQKHLEVIQSYYGRSKDRTLSWRLIETLVRSMFSTDYGNLDGKIARVDFYGNDGVCLFKFFVTRDDPQWIFTMVTLVISIVCFIIVAAAYICINISTFRSSKSLTKEAGPTAKTVNKRNRKLQRKVATIILTDFFCWVPFVFICILHFFEVMDASSYYGFFSIIILPINSVINPFLYSEIMLNLATKVWAVLAKLLVRFFSALARSGDVDNQNVIVNQIQKGNQQAIELKTMTKTMSVN